MKSPIGKRKRGGSDRGGGSTYFPIRLSVGTRNSRFAQLLSYPPPAAGSLPLFYICLQSSPLFALSSFFPIFVRFSLRCIHVCLSITLHNQTFRLRVSLEQEFRVLARLDGRWVLQSYWCWWSNDFTSSTSSSLVSVSPFLSLSLCTRILSRLHQRTSRALQRNLPIETKDTQTFYRENVSIVFQPLPHNIELISQITIECFCMFFEPFFGKI